jgi:hypothetical protein
MVPRCFAAALAVALLASTRAAPSDTGAPAARIFSRSLPESAAELVKATLKETGDLLNATATSAYLRGIDVSHYQV